LIQVKKHIALSLLGLFIVPVLFQSVHIVWHHSYGQPETCEGSCCTGNNHALPDDLSILSQQFEHCPICEYQFTIVSLPDFSIFEAVLPAITGICGDIASEPPLQQRFSLKSPRAPPFKV
jgi:hypothetical protein